ncbi:TetR/AcrR family transcriptional regulator [Jiangella anatolica]|uniref:TetR family transcriptional regulator n=1 Tax=Jiangella anatolica TaxID=2670374 RepID=A0A2W2BMZ3_9ACTN|nr:TetR/AcrR family transcriptional regulator [Jiangella anatolica]PZF86660.1 TetR family transcriptional regulator [Jiangella anatolica]
MATRGPYAKGEAKRAEVVDVALELFSRKGYDRTSFREVARLAGLSQSGLLHHFRTKEELFVEVLRRRDELNERFYDETVEHDVTIDGLTEIIKHNSVEPGLVRLYVSMSAESTDATSPARQFFVDRYQTLRADIAADIRRKQATGDLPDSLDPLTVASLVIAAADGLQLQWLLDPDQVDMGAMLEQLTVLLRGGGSPRPAENAVEA